MRWRDGSELTPRELAQVDRCLAGLREYVVARFNLGLAMSEAAGAMRNFAAAWQAAEDHLCAAEALEIAGHPDLSELNVRLDGFYDPPASAPRTHI